MTSESISATERVPVLMYHRIGDVASDWEIKYCVSPERFAKQMKALKRVGMTACSIEEFVAWLSGQGVLPQRAFVLTFDDGFQSVYEHAYPLLVEMGWPATVFLVSSLVGKEDEWSRRENHSARTYPLLGRTEIGEMRRNGFSFHSHSRTHCDLTTLSGTALLEETAGSKRDLEDLLGYPVSFFAYPYGRYNTAVLEATQAAGYRAAVSVQPGFNRQAVDRYCIRRIDVFGTDTAMAVARKIKRGTNDGSTKQMIRYYLNRVVARVGSGKQAE